MFTDAPGSGSAVTASMTVRFTWTQVEPWYGGAEADETSVVSVASTWLSLDRVIVTTTFL